MTPPAVQLLVSVRSVEEARSAVRGGCDILDVKEPARGSLGMADVETIREIATSQDSNGRDARLPVSAALGEVADWISQENVPILPKGLTYAKLGLSSLHRRRDWRADWLAVRRRFDDAAETSLNWIAVAYADAVAAESPQVAAVARAAVETNCSGLLIDTFHKTGRTLLDEIQTTELASVLNDARRAGLLTALAGAVTIEMLPQLRDLGPDVVAVRTAACRERIRENPIDADAVAGLRRALQLSKRSYSGASLPSKALHRI